MADIKRRLDDLESFARCLAMPSAEWDLSVLTPDELERLREIVLKHPGAALNDPGITADDQSFLADIVAKAWRAA